MIKFIALSSSRGTTLEAILKKIRGGTLAAECLGLLTDSADRGCIEKARNAGIPAFIIERNSGETREIYDQRLDEKIEQILYSNSITDRKEIFIAAVGWLWLLSPWFVSKWKNRILNVHPSLLPKFPGKNASQDVLAAGEKETGMTIHLIDEGIDTGKILLQKSCPILPDDTEETLKTRVQELEKQWYPEALAMLERGEIIISN